MRPSSSIISTEVLIPAADNAANVDGYSYCSRILGWLQGPEEVQPPVEHLTSIPISFPLLFPSPILFNLTPGSFLALVHGATGHSQALFTVILATSARFKFPSRFSMLVCGRKLFLFLHSNCTLHKILLKAMRVTRHPRLSSRASHVLPSSPTLDQRTSTRRRSIAHRQRSP